jgi:hypothetical protein
MELLEIQNLAGTALMLGAFGWMSYHAITGRKDFITLHRVFWPRLRTSMLWQLPLVLAAVVGTFTVLADIPALDIGWSRIVTGENRNMITAPLTGLHPMVGVLFMGVLLFVMPALVYVEERMFRRGHETWSGMALWSLLFGLAHMAAGISLAVALTLAVPGFFFALKYRQAYRRHWRNGLFVDDARNAATLESAAWHLGYNTMVLTVGMGWMVWKDLAG